jgi:hypothetical protein
MKDCGRDPKGRRRSKFMIAINEALRQKDRRLDSPLESIAPKDQF